VLLDWALADWLSREQRRRLMLLFSAVAFRNPAAAAEQIDALSEGQGQRTAKSIRGIVDRFLAELPMAKLPRAVDAMALVQEAALAGVRFPSSLIMFSKVLFTLDGVLDDIRGNGTTAEFTIARYLVQRWMRKPLPYGLPLSVRDWMGVECSALLFGGQVAIRCEEVLWKRVFGGKHVARQDVAVQ
jgi:ubiquinone biosynthesis protein